MAKMKRKDKRELAKAKKEMKKGMREYKIRRRCGGGGYFLGFIGAVVYYISTATGFWNGVLGVLKALIWPAMVVFEALKYMGA